MTLHYRSMLHKLHIVNMHPFINTRYRNLKYYHYWTRWNPHRTWIHLRRYRLSVNSRILSLIPTSCSRVPRTATFRHCFLHTRMQLICRIWYHQTSQKLNRNFQDDNSAALISNKMWIKLWVLKLEYLTRIWISSSEIVQSKTAAFSSTRSSFDDFGMVI